MDFTGSDCTVMCMTQNYPGNEPQYGQSNYDAPAYGHGYGAAYGGDSNYGSFNEPKPQGKKLGITALILSIVALVMGVGLSIGVGVYLGSFLSTVPNPADLDNAAVPDDVAVMAGLMMLGYIIPSLVGVAAIIFAIIAMVKKNARGMAIIGLIIAILAPIIAGVTYLVVGTVYVI